MPAVTVDRALLERALKALEATGDMAWEADSEAGRHLLIQLRAALAEVEQPDDWDIRGILAAKLTCWHRLTGDEAAELVALFSASPASVKPLTDEQIENICVETWLKTGPFPTNIAAYKAISRNIEAAHGIKEQG